jgi:hypothetical protein
MRIPLTCLTVFICSFALAQSPWVAEKGKGFAQIGYTTIGPYDNLYQNDGDSYSLSRDVTDQTIQLFAEYGIGNNNSLIASIPLKLLKTGQSTILNPAINEGSFSTLGNIQLAVRHNFINNGFVLSSQLLTEIPSAGYDEATGLRGGLDALSFVPTISIGKGLANLYGYLSAGVAIRSNEYSSDFRISGELGYKLVNRIYVIAVLDVVENFENGSAVETVNQLQTGLYLNNQSFFAYGIKGIIGFTDNIGVSGAFYGASSGHLVAKSPSINFGVYYKW